MREEILDQIPSLGSLYGTALGRTARAAAPAFFAGGPAPTTLPDLRYIVPQVTVDTRHLAEYQHLIGEAGTDALPAGYVHVLAFPLAMQLMVRPDFPLPVLGMVHVANRVEQLHPLRLTDTLQVQAWARGLRAHRSGTQVDLVVEVAGQEGPEVAWRGVSTYLAKGTRVPGLALAEPVGGTGGGAPGGGAAVTGPGGSAGGSGGADGERFDAPALTDPLPEATATWRLTPRSARRYASVSGDRNPIHMSALSAKPFGFPRAIAHGMDTAARALAAVGSVRGPAFTWTVQFAKPVLLPSTVSFGQRRTEAGSYTYAGWKRGSDRVHFTGAVRPLP